MELRDIPLYECPRNFLLLILFLSVGNAVVNILVHVHYFAFMKEYPQDKFLKVIIGSNGICTCLFFIIIYIFIFSFYLDIIAVQCYISFRCIAK